MCVSNPVIEVTVVGDDERLDTLPTYFGDRFLEAENAIFAYMRHLCENYSGGYWTFYETTNGAFFMAPDIEGTVRVSNPGNGAEAEVSWQAAGLIACVFAVNHCVWTYRTDQFGEQYDRLMAYVYDHPESWDILLLID
ncbi:antirestriction protein [Marinobacter sp. 3-2]|jgi:hypothetical protein|uniref:antirestriction protein n=1 Tax=Marinobacter sp. 3-2 TaxID=2485141 RepID=UPI000787B0E2|nr:antirestriction protein [Marinobacter sp. 3-2]ROQ49303.1 antirestriction protein [Marinobacter sp. 3-2]|tara:strand:- start:1778 stop:2191 length:414 start_codon:yes stop_codon:yes gene_type:complete